MAKKNKKGKKHKTFYKAVKPFIKDNRVVLGLLGALGAGVALASALGPNRAGSLVDGITAAVKHLTHHSHLPEEETKKPKKNKEPKLKELGKPIAIEHS